MKSGKTTSNRRNRTTKSRQDQNAHRKRDLQILRNLGLTPSNKSK